MRAGPLGALRAFCWQQPCLSFSQPSIAFDTTSGSAFPVWVASGLVRVGKTDTGRHSFFHHSVQRTRRNCRHAGHRAGPRWWLEQCECERLGTDRARRRNDPGIEPGAVPRVLHHRDRHRELRRRPATRRWVRAPIPNRFIPFNDPEHRVASVRNGGHAQGLQCNHQRRAESTYWIDISVPRGVTTSPPGTYTGTISIAACSGQYDHSGHAHGVEL